MSTLTLDSLLRMNRYFCEEPLDDDEVWNIWRSSQKYRKRENPIGENKDPRVKVEKKDAIVPIQKTIKDFLITCGEIKEQTEGNYIITPDAIMRASLKFETEVEAADFVKMYFKAFHNEKVTYSILADLLTGLSVTRTDKGIIQLIRVYKRSGKVTYKYYNIDEGIWTTIDVDDIKHLLRYYLRTYKLEDYQAPQKIEKIQEVLEMKARPGDLPHAHGVQFNNGFYNFIKRQLVVTSPFNFAQGNVPIDVHPSEIMNPAVTEYLLQMGRYSSTQIKTVKNFILLCMLGIKELPYALYFSGPPGSGKSCFVELIQEIFNVYCHNIELKDFEGGFCIENLHNKLILLCPEIPYKPCQAVLNTLKSFLRDENSVGQKTHKSSSINFEGGLFVGCSNKKWDLQEEIVPFFKRILYVELEQRVNSQQKDDLKRVFLKNLPAITNCIMNGHYLQLLTYTYHEEISAAIHQDLTHSPIILWLQQTSELYFVEGGDCVIKSDIVEIKTSTTKQIII